MTKNVGDDVKKQIDALLEEGYDEWLMHNSGKAIDLFEQVLESDPENYKAIFYRLLSIAISNEESELNSIVFDFIPIANKELSKVIVAMRSQKPSDKEFTEACVEFVVELSILCCGALRLLDNFDENDSFEPRAKIVLILNNFLVDILNILDSTDDACDGFYEMLLKYMTAYVNDVDEVMEKNYSECYLLVSKHCNLETKSADFTQLEAMVNKSKDRVDSLAKENEELTKVFREFMNVVEESLAEIEKDFECEELKEKEKILHEIDLLKKQKESLTFFKFKEKKQLQELIAEKTDCINVLNITIDEKKNERDEALSTKAQDNHEKAGVILQTIQRNANLMDKISNRPDIWFHFVTINTVREEE